MLIDTSALMAILLREPEAAVLEDAILAAASRRMAAPSVAEAYVALQWKVGPRAALAVDALLKHLEIEIVAMPVEAVGAARDAFTRYGKGTGSPAGLNYGDCLTYGVAQALGEPLLFKGNDFSRTDIPAVGY